MKAERRHELKTNTLAKNLEKAPEFFQQHGSQLLLGLVLCLLAFILVRNHYADKAKRAEEVKESLGTALYSLSQLRTMSPFRKMDEMQFGKANESPFRSPEELAQRRKTLYEEIEKAIGAVLEKTEDPKIRATALLVRGDLNWQMANAPALPTTRPEKDTRSSDDYLNSAETAYNEVTRPPQDENHADVVSARFGLAAIAENRQQWDKARQFYQAIIDDGSAGKAFTDMAKERQDQLKLWEKPVVLGKPAPREPRIKPQAPLIPSAPEKLGPVLPAIPTPATTQPSLSIPAPSEPSIGIPTIPTSGPSVIPATGPSAATKP